MGVIERTETNRKSPTDFGQRQGAITGIAVSYAKGRIQTIGERLQMDSPTDIQRFIVANHQRNKLGPRQAVFVKSPPGIRHQGNRIPRNRSTRYGASRSVDDQHQSRATTWTPNAM